MCKIKFLVLLIVFLGCTSNKNCVQNIARSKKIMGTVYVNNIPNLYVRIRIENTKIKTFTDINGIYSILVNNNDKLIFEAFGCESKTVSVKNKDTIDVYFQEDEKILKKA